MAKTSDISCPLGRQHEDPCIPGFSCTDVPTPPCPDLPDCYCLMYPHMGQPAVSWSPRRAVFEERHQNVGRRQSEEK